MLDALPGRCSGWGRILPMWRMRNHVISREFNSLQQRGSSDFVVVLGMDQIADQGSRLFCAAAELLSASFANDTCGPDTCSVRATVAAMAVFGGLNMPACRAGF